MGGLYSLVTTKSDGAIVSSLEDDSKKFVSGRKHDFTPLESIEVYTTGSNAPLSDVFVAMHEHPDAVSKINPNKASKEELYGLMAEVYPELDADRVYPSDIKKMVKWYRILDEKKMIADLVSEANAAEEEE